MKNPEKIEDLIEQCKRQNSQAQMEIYRLYYQAMFNVSYRIVNGFEDAEDVMQEAFIKAFKNIHKYSYKSTFGAWLKRIVINESLNQIRKEKKVKWDISAITNEEETEEECDFSRLKAEKIVEAMSLLNNRYRVLMNLHFIEGYDYEEIQEITGITYGNLRTLFSRAKKSLKIILEKEYGITK